MISEIWFTNWLWRYNFFFINFRKIKTNKDEISWSLTKLIQLLKDEEKNSNSSEEEFFEKSSPTLSYERTIGIY